MTISAEMCGYALWTASSSTLDSRRPDGTAGRSLGPGRAPHACRTCRAVDPRQPLHVTVRMRPAVWNLRSHRCFVVLERAFYKCLERSDARFAHFSVQGNHVHMLVEASGVSALARMMQSFCIRSAKGLNKVIRRRWGTVFGDRYHSRSLKTPTQTRAPLV